MTTSSSPRPLPAPLVRLSGPDDLAHAVPLLVGFHPRESLVVLFLAGARSRLVLTARVDLPPADQEAALARQFLARAQHAGADRLVLWVHTSAPATPAGLPRAGLVRALAASGRGPETVQALLVRDGRWWSYLSADPGPGTPVSGSAAADRLAAEQALSGRGVLPDRDALVASVAAPPVDPALARRYLAAEADHRRRTAGSRGRARAAQQTVRAVLALVAEPPDSDGPAHETVLTAAVGLADLLARDRALAALPPDSGVTASLVRAVRRCPRPFDAGLCGVLAWRAYSDGDGALARVALDRALASSPDHGLARLLDDALDRQVPPSVLADVLAAIGPELG